MRKVQANIFWCFVEALRQMNNTAVLVSPADEVVNQSILLLTEKIIKHNQLLVSAWKLIKCEDFIIAALHDIISDYS